jgi:hypothetical protein
MEEQLFYAKANISGRDVDLVFTESQILDGVKLAMTNCELVCENNPGNCWSTEKPQGCSLWKKMFNLCGCKEEKKD